MVKLNNAQDKLDTFNRSHFQTTGSSEGDSAIQLFRLFRFQIQKGQLLHDYFIVTSQQEKKKNSYEKKNYIKFRTLSRFSMAFNCQTKKNIFFSHFLRDFLLVFFSLPFPHLQLKAQESRKLQDCQMLPPTPNPKQSSYLQAFKAQMVPMTIVSASAEGGVDQIIKFFFVLFQELKDSHKNFSIGNYLISRILTVLYTITLKISCFCQDGFNMKIRILKKH